MIDQRIETSLLNATILRYQSEKESAIAELLVYLRNPVAIGDHPGFLDEIDKLVDAACTAEVKLNFLQRTFAMADDNAGSSQG